jgi:hypothetical protein
MPSPKCKKSDVLFLEVPRPDNSLLVDYAESCKFEEQLTSLLQAIDISQDTHKPMLGRAPKPAGRSQTNF